MSHATKFKTTTSIKILRNLKIDTKLNEIVKMTISVLIVYMYQPENPKLYENKTFNYGSKSAKIYFFVELTNR